MSTTATAIDRIQRHAKLIAAGECEQVKPGQPVRFTEAASINDTIRQGDLYITVIEAVPQGFVKIAKPKAMDKQLVPGNTQGAKHCLDSLAGVTMYRPTDWGPESLTGPVLVLSKERTILHPTHGSVTIPSGVTVQCTYQREWESEQRKERRTRD